MQSERTAGRSRGFTLIELMVVVGIITVLISILIPVVGRMRTAARNAAVKNQISQIMGAIERFNLEQHQFPGPLPDSKLYTSGRGGSATAPQIYDANGAAVLMDANKITQAENLVLGLAGGLKWKTTGSGTVLCFDPALIGRGMVGMNSAVPKKFEPYLSIDTKMLSTGKYSDAAGSADDSVIPEFVDSYPDPMPILYMRAHTGATGVVRNDVPEVATDPVRQYALSDIYPYTHTWPNGSGPLAHDSIGVGKKIRIQDYVNSPTAATTGLLPHGLQSVNPNRTLDRKDQYPYDLFPYVLNPSVAPSNPADPNGTGTARSKDTYILISAGPDRVYGTPDDICSFGSVTE